MKLCFAFGAFVLLATICNSGVTGQSNSATGDTRASSRCPNGWTKTNKRCYFNYDCDSGVGICKGGYCCKKAKNPNKGRCPRDYKQTNRKCRSNRDCGRNGLCKNKRCCEQKKNPNKGNCPYGYKETNRRCKRNNDCGRNGICYNRRCCKSIRG